MFPDDEHFGRIFYNQATLSAEGIPQIAVVMGSCTAGGAYVPAMSDEAIIVKGTGTIFLGGPPLVKAATGEDVTAEELGGADVHTPDRPASPIISRRTTIMRCESRATSSARSTAASRQRFATRSRPKNRCTPRKKSTASCRATFRETYDVREVIARIVDGSKFRRVQGALRRNSRTRLRAHSRLSRRHHRQQRHSLFSESALQGRALHRALRQRGIPLVFLQNITGFMVGRKYEAGGIAKDGAKMVHAVPTAACPS